ncbi:MAG: acyltransferase [Lachnospiraceae bacterium]
MEQQGKLGFIDGLKAIATILVFNIHFINAYYCGVYTLDPKYFHTQSGIEWYIGATPLNLIYAGKVGARIFLCLSAFLLARSFFLSKHGSDDAVNILVKASVKKYLRLVCPIIVVNLFVFSLMRCGAYHNGEVAVLANSVEFFGPYNQFSPHLFAALKEAVWDCFVTGGNAYNGPLWFIHYEFWGCILVAVILALTGKRRMRYLLYGVLALVLIRSDYLSMILAVVVADLIYTQADRIRSLTQKQWLMWMLLVVSLYFVTYPSYGDNLQGSIYAILPPKVLFYYNVAIPMMLLAIYYLRPVQQLLERKGLCRFQKISYSFYLIHFPLICTLSTAFFLVMYNKINYHILFLLNYVLTFTISTILAWVLTKLIDQPGTKMAEKITRHLIRKRTYEDQ